MVRRWDFCIICLLGWVRFLTRAGSRESRRGDVARVEPSQSGRLGGGKARRGNYTKEDAVSPRFPYYTNVVCVPRRVNVSPKIGSHFGTRFVSTLIAFPVVQTPNTTDSPPDAEQARWFAEAVHAHDSSLKAFLRSSYPAVRDVEDVVQESYLRIWKARALHPITSAKAFLFQIARRLAVDSVRRERHDFVADVRELPADGVYSSSHHLEHERSRLLADAVESLPARCREIFVMRKLQGMSQRETATRLGLSERTVEVQISRAMSRCAAFLRRHGVTGFENGD